jgi:hypothetical protein
MSRRQQLTDSARLLRVRLNELESRKRNLPDIDRPAHEVATRAVREELTRVGQQLRQLG